jgi:beta-glucosidase-like glycosyl hydrolase
MGATKDIGFMIDKVNMALDAGCDYVLWCHAKENLEAKLDLIAIKTGINPNNQIELMKPLMKHEETPLSINELILELDHLLNSSANL